VRGREYLVYVFRRRTACLRSLLSLSRSLARPPLVSVHSTSHTHTNTLPPPPSLARFCMRQTRAAKGVVLQIFKNYPDILVDPASESRYVSYIETQTRAGGVLPQGQQQCQQVRLLSLT